MTRRLVALAVLVLLPLTLSACVFEVQEITPSTDGASVDVPAAADVPEPVPSAGTPAAVPPLDVDLDPSGRPYDVSLQDGFTVRTDLVGRLRLEGTPLVAGPGEGVLRSSGDEVVTVPLPRLDLVEVHVVAAGPGPGDGSVAGVVLRAPGGVVSAWSRFEPAYGTDGGMGAVWVEDATGGHGDPRVDAVADGAVDQLIAGASWVLTDADGDGDDDTFLFGNGWGDGGFPMSRGTDRTGQVVAVAVWHGWVPWRLAVEDGTPPPDVSEAEDELAACLAAGRTPLLDGTCAG